MATRSVGLDIGTHAVHVAEISVSRQGPRLTNFGGIALPAQAVDEGEVVDAGAVTAAIEQLWSDAGIRDKRVQIGVSNQRVVVRPIDLPYMEESELREALNFQVQEHIPIPVENAELDFHTLEEFTGEGEARMIRILLVAADKEMVARHLEAVTQAGLRPVGVDLNAFAVMRAVAPDPETAEGSEMIVDVGAGVTNVVVHQQGKPRFVRILVLGGDDITQGVVSSLGVSEKDAETTKHREGLGGHSESADAIEQRVDEFVDEMRGSLDYYLAQSGSSQVRRLLISGGGSKLSGLRDRLADTLRIPVESSTPMRHLPVADTAYSQEQLDEIQPVLVTAIGLALGGLQ